MGSGQLVFSGHTMKSFLVAASIASVALTAPYNPYSPFLLNPYPSLYYNPYNRNGLSSIVSVRGYKAVAGDNGDLKGAVHEVPGHYSNAAIAPLASNAQLQKSNVPWTATFNAFNSPVHLDGIVPKGESGNYNGKQQDKIAVLPSAKSALAYMKSYFGDGDLCSESGTAYIKSILSGATGAEANAAAESAYKAAWDKGARLSPGSVCAASETAFKEAYSSGKGSILESARAFVNNWPGLKTGNPCAVSGKAYMDAIIDGKSVDDAGYLSGKAFIAAFGDLASSGNSIEDPACADAAKAYLESSNTPDSARTPSPPTSSLRRPSSRSTPRAARLLEPTHPVSRRTRTPCWLSSTRRSTTVPSCSPTPCVAPPPSPTWTPRSPGKAISRLEQIPQKPILRPLLPTMERGQRLVKEQLRLTSKLSEVKE